MGIKPQARKNKLSQQGVAPLNCFKNNHVRAGVKKGTNLNLFAYKLSLFLPLIKWKVKQNFKK
jgi:hypothetical protein